MRRSVLILLGVLSTTSLHLLPAAAGQFDGRWNVTLACPDGRDGSKAFSWQFNADVTNSVIHGEHGDQNQPGWMSLDGTIQNNGDANLMATGLTGGAAYNLGHTAHGIPYQHPVTAHFDTAQGKGQWVTTRVCPFTFTKL
ncbi:MAG TPA: hypothetical protein VMA09_00330 [Candidatus Binataceae bacterium]|nr:hypothetical protein [Candidatus Binataceae bacterium]